LKDFGKNKLDTRDIERKVEDLQSKNYTTLIERIQGDLKVLKEENSKMVALYQSKMSESNRLS
jgi:hypothetical protein